MKRIPRGLLASLILMPLLLLVGAVHAQDEGEPEATFNFSTNTVQVGIGFTWGQGTLHFGEQVYSFDVTGFNLVGVGFTEARFSGEARNLMNAADFAGTYKGGAGGLTIGGGGTFVSMTNDKGVKMKLTSESEGVQMNIGGGGIKVKNVTLVTPE